jgi:hypothetical protein
MVPHFRHEETVFPLLVEADGDGRALLVHALLDRQRLHALASRLIGELAAGALSPMLLSETGALLEAHVRFRFPTRTTSPPKIIVIATSAFIAPSSAEVQADDSACDDRSAAFHPRVR